MDHCVLVHCVFEQYHKRLKNIKLSIRQINPVFTFFNGKINMFKHTKPNIAK